MHEEIQIKGSIKDNILNVKFRIYNPMFTEKQAIKNKEAQNHITYIIVKIGTRILYEFKLSAAIVKNPIFKFKVKQKEIKTGDVMKIEWRTLLGTTEQYSIEIKESFNNLSKP